MHPRASTALAIVPLLGTLILLTIMTPAGATTIDGRLAYLSQHGDKQASSFPGSIRFTGPPDASELAALQDLGIAFGTHHGRTVFPARTPFAALSALARRPGIVYVDSDLRFATGPPLIEALRQSETDLAQRVSAPQGGTLTGRGVVIANLDTGIDIHHMAFFQLTDERHVWHDIDADGDGRRGYGLPGFGEHDPTYGERLFIGEDSDGDGRLDPQEHLIALGPSKIRAIRDTDG
jgi:hypothetical protein